MSNFIKRIDLGKKRRSAKLIYLGNVARPYGINEADTWSLDHHLAAVIANGLRMLVAYGNACHDEEALEAVASKLEFYATDVEAVIIDNIDWSQDDSDEIIVDENGRWISPVGQPGFDEYCAKSAVATEVQQRFARDAFIWLADHWGELWD